MVFPLGVGAHVGVAAHPQEQRVGRPGVFDVTFVEGPGDPAQELLVEAQDVLAPAGTGAGHAFDIAPGVVVVKDVLGGQRPDPPDHVGVEGSEAVVETLELFIALEQLADPLLPLDA